MASGWIECGSGAELLNLHDLCHIYIWSNTIEGSGGAHLTDNAVTGHVIDKDWLIMGIFRQDGGRGVVLGGYDSFGAAKVALYNIERYLNGEITALEFAEQVGGAYDVDVED